ncbi:uncharacterized protein LOC105190446 isoform X2 [Harpegnathos saltator]|uniref:uncharacterized protein LOC105190446 isoform X2 n=1 Tax=Harpegnathos saltator TaxID=610380 RepID=UPI000DBED8F6|nr:uncharacterized protein LOC105190446 isoform X2 [Harpegnathos saltator]
MNEPLWIFLCQTRLDAPREMISFETEYLSMNRILLLMIGMWPYQQSKVVQLQIILFYGIFISMIIFQVKYFLEEFQYIYNELKNENEIAIIQNYGSKAKLYTAVLILFGICCVVILVAQPWCPYLLDIILLVNNSRPHPVTYIITEYFIDKERYFYINMLHMNIVISLGTVVLLATGTMLIACAKCICGIFRIASYRIERAMEINIACIVYVKDDIMIHNEIIHAVDIHRKAMTFTKFLLASFEGSFFCIMTCGVITLSLNLYRIFQIMSFGGSVEELIVHYIFTGVIFMYILVSNYFAQEILDHNNQVFAAVYNIQWYTTPLYIQRMILFLLQNGTKTLTLNIGGLFAASLEGTATLISAAMSYFTVLCSTQN